MLIDIADGFFLARFLQSSLGLGPATKQTIGSSLPLVELPLDLLARFS
jgi:hypothetical protein